MTDSRPMSYSRAELTTMTMPHMANILGDLFGGQLMALIVEDSEAVAQQLAAARVGLQRFHEHARVAPPVEGDSAELVDREWNEQRRLVESIAQRKERHDGRAVEKHGMQEEVCASRECVRTEPHVAEVLT